MRSPPESQQPEQQPPPERYPARKLKLIGHPTETCGWAVVDAETGQHFDGIHSVQIVLSATNIANVIIEMWACCMEIDITDLTDRACGLPRASVEAAPSP